MLETEPTMSVSKIVNLMKSYTIYHVWEKHPHVSEIMFGKRIRFIPAARYVPFVGIRIKMQKICL